MININCRHARGDYTQSFKDALNENGLQLVSPEILWLTPPKTFLGIHSALFSARSPNELGDIYHARVRIGRQGTVLNTWWLTNITRTSSADERSLIALGPYAAYSSRLGEVYDAVVILDTRGESPELTANWPLYAKTQNAITNFQETGHFRGSDLKRYHLNPPVRQLQIRTNGDSFIVEFDGEQIVLNPRKDLPLTRAGHVQLQKKGKGASG